MISERWALIYTPPGVAFRVGTSSEVERVAAA
jgi:hypothetical protein